MILIVMKIAYASTFFVQANKGDVVKIPGLNLEGIGYREQELQVSKGPTLLQSSQMGSDTPLLVEVLTSSSRAKVSTLIQRATPSG